MTVSLVGGIMLTIKLMLSEGPAGSWLCRLTR